MSDVVKQDCELRCFVFLSGDLDSFKAQVVKYPAHQVHGTERVLKAGVDSSGIDEVG